MRNSCKDCTTNHEPDDDDDDDDDNDDDDDDDDDDDAPAPRRWGSSESCVISRSCTRTPGSLQSTAAPMAIHELQRRDRRVSQSGSCRKRTEMQLRECAKEDGIHRQRAKKEKMAWL